MNNYRNILALAFGIFLIIVMVLLYEAGLRWIVPTSEKYFVYPPGKVARIEPLPDVMTGIHDISKFTINSDGIRGEEFSEKRNEFRLLVIGGSTAECLYLDDTETWPFLIQKILRQNRTDKHVIVNNAGKAGANSRDNLMHVKYLLPQLPHIDIVLVLVGVNDLNVHLAQGWDYIPEPSINEPEVELKQLRRAFSRLPGRIYESAPDTLDANMFGYKKTVLYNAFLRKRSALNWTLMGLGIRKYKGGWEYESLRMRRQKAAPFIDKVPDLNLPLRDYAQNLNHIIDVVQENGSQIVLITQPSIWRKDLDPEMQSLLWFGGQGNFLEEEGHPYYSVSVLEQAMDLYNHELLRICERRGVDCIDVATQMARTTENFYDDVHFTELGAQRLAEIVSEFLLSRYDL